MSCCSRSHRRRFTVLDFNVHLWTSGVSLDTSVRFADPDFLLKCKISAIWRRFPLIFSFYMPSVRHISTSSLFDLLTYKVYHKRRPPRRLFPPSLKPIRRSVLELWVTTFPIGYHWKCVRCHCACAWSRDAWVGGQKQLHFWNPRPRFGYLLYNIYWATTTINGRLLSSPCVNLFCVTLWPWP